MTTEHPITPPPNLRRLWAQQAQRLDPHDPVAWMEHVSTQAARWGADQELEACCGWLEQNCGRWKLPAPLRAPLRAARRPKPQNLKEQALAKTEAILNDPGRVLLTEVREALELNRRALKRLKELEQQENNDN